MPDLARAVWIVVASKLALHLLASTGALTDGYGYFGDELYYLACAEHLGWGYVDQPPLSIALLAGWEVLFGDSLASIRVLAALFGAAAVFAAGALARELGGRARAQVLTAAIVALAPVNLVVHGFYSMNAIDILIWEVAFIAIARLVRDPSPGRWLALGALLGVGLMNKFSVLWLGAGFFLGLLVTPHRALLRSPWPWAAGVLALLLFAPHLVWQAAHDFPTAEFMATATAKKMVRVGPLDLFAQQALVMLPVALPIWLSGLWLLFRADARGPERLFGIVFLTTSAILIVNGTSRPNYLALAQPPLLAAGAIGIERLAERAGWRWLPATAIGAVALVGLLIAPLSIPVLEPEALARFSQQIGIGAPKMENRDRGSLDPHFADTIGWDRIVDAVAKVVAELPDADRARAGLIGLSYGEAGALDQLGPARGLPSAASPHNQYWLWGPGSEDGAVMVIAGGPREMWQPYWRSLEAAGSWDCGLCLPGRNHQTVWIAREPTAPMQEIWRALRRYN